MISPEIKRWKNQLTEFPISWKMGPKIFFGQFLCWPSKVTMKLGNDWTLCNFSDLKHENSWNWSKNKIFIGISLNFLCIFGYLPNLRLQKYESAENYNKPFITLFIYIIKCPGICEILTYFTGHRLVLNKSYEEILLGQSLWITL